MRPRRSWIPTTDPTSPALTPTPPIGSRRPPRTTRQPVRPKLAQRPASAPIPDRNTSGRSLSPADRNRNPLLRIPFISMTRPENRRVRQAAVGVLATKQAVLLLGVFGVGEDSFVTKLGEIAKLGC